MRIGKYHIEVHYQKLLKNNYEFHLSHKYWYLWIICLSLFNIHIEIEICRTDWNKCYKENCKNYTNKCKHCMDCNECKECFLRKNWLFLNNLYFNMENLLKRETELKAELSNIREEIKKKRLEGIDYTGKYVKMEDYGYMYVTWQNYEAAEDKMFFQGVAFNISDGDYRDDFFATADALQEWWIPCSMFERWHDKGEILEITKEEFNSLFHKLIDSFVSKWDNKLNKIEESYESTIKE